MIEYPPPTTVRSREMYEEAKEVAPGGVQGQGRFFTPHPIYLKKVQGSRIWDVDGNEFLDYQASMGPALLGHSEPRVDDEVYRVMKDEGLIICYGHPREVALAETMRDIIPFAQKTSFHGGGGSDALYYALRLARAFTGRQKLLKFEGGYHGWHDEFAVSLRPSLDIAGPADKPNSIPMSYGALPVHAQNVVVAPFNDEVVLERLIRENHQDLAAVFVEPIMHWIGVVTPKPGFLQLLRELCTQYGILLVFDEIVTGFRHGIAGAGVRLGVEPDLAAFGKAMANGYIMAALTGRTDVMSQLGPEGPVYFSGTFSGHILSVAAAAKTIEILREEPVHDKLFRLGDMLSSGVNSAIEQTGVNAVCQQYGSAWCLYFGTRKVENYRDAASTEAFGDSELNRAYRNHLATNGIWIHPKFVNRGYISYAHTEEDIERTVDVTSRFIRENAALLSA